MVVGGGGGGGGGGVPLSKSKAQKSVYRNERIKNPIPIDFEESAIQMHKEHEEKKLDLDLDLDISINKAMPTHTVGNVIKSVPENKHMYLICLFETSDRFWACAYSKKQFVSHSY